MNNKRLKIALAALGYIAFFAFAVLVQKIDVQAIGPYGTPVGFAHLNGGALSLFGSSDMWYEITQVIGWLALLVCGCFAIAGLVQLIQRKSLLKVDFDILALGILYVLCIGFYVVFNKVVINFRPVLEKGELEASFPSSHTVLGLCVFVSLAIWLGRKAPKSKAWAGQLMCIGLALLAVIGRFLSGMHWATDILGGLILSFALLMTFAALLPKAEPIPEPEEEEEEASWTQEACEHLKELQAEGKLDLPEETAEVQEAENKE